MAAPTHPRSGLDTALTPLRFLERAVEVHPDKTAVIDGARRATYREFGDHVVALADALRRSGVDRGDSVAYLASNSMEMLAAHFAVPLAGGVLVAVNTRLAAEEIRYICDHSRSVLLIGEGELLEGCTDVEFATVREVIETPEVDGGYRGAGVRYDELLARGSSDAAIAWTVDDEDAVIAINYTSGTTGRPKGVMYTHRGAYLSALGAVITHDYSIDTRYLWSLPMFHCNGWCKTWALTGVSATHVCLRAVRGEEMWHLIDSETITHMSGAPTVLTTLATAPEAHPLDRPMSIATAGAPPSPTVIAAIRHLGITLVHVYGLTETYGPYSVCEPDPSWSGLSEADISVRMARQGVGELTAERMRVVRPDVDDQGRLCDVAADGVEMGEIVMCGNMVMKGYFEDAQRTSEVFVGGWFHSGDLVRMDDEGYVWVVDRKKDMIISGGENIYCAEVENVLADHPAIVEVAVIGRAHPKWGEVPVAVAAVSEAGLLLEHLEEFLNERLARYKHPKGLEIVDALPRNPAGKVLKSRLNTPTAERAAAVPA